MKKIKPENKSIASSPVNWILGGLAATTLYFQTNAADPFNSPKAWIIYIVASWLIGYIAIFKKFILSNKELIFLFYLVLFFVLSGFFATAFSDFKYVSVFGDTQRRNGFISYSALVVIFFAAALFFRFFNIKKLFFITQAIAIVTIAYGIIQTTGNDFIKWNNPHNSLIGTLGNPNFASALMAIMGVVCFGSIFIKNFSISSRVFAGLISALNLALIYRSNARQGMLAFLLGIGIFLIIWLLSWRKKIGIMAITFGSITFAFAVLGMLQIGPLEKLLYKSSVTVRGYYWRAGIEMFKDYPIFGVGMDRYGAFFDQYREIGYPLNYGFQLTSTNAHNTFIQFFATGGIFLGLSYLLLNLYILKRAIFSLRSNTGNNRLVVASLLSAWIAFHAQSLVSIDNIGVSIWGWILGGALIGLSISTSTSDDTKIFIQSKNIINLKRVSISTIGTLISACIVILLQRGEVSTYMASSSFYAQDQQSVALFKQRQFNAINTFLNDPNYKLKSGQNLFQIGLRDEGINTIKELTNEDPRNLMALNSLAEIYESLGKYSEAIIYREKIARINQWNALNYLALGKDYKALGNLAKTKEILDKILAFATGPNGTPVAEQAKKELL